ncbi:uncharacterized protein Z519_04578 [Cladophialophora bantiana CBS 173.52]|uniref:Uncharacterized protein n=1 Tax=Cladophialophora bantiana (strain ATCC 10958 / CBS 173.52 / CDC B-1940 / NIH 8579) TaxID=1442370 RepID=A0A0D2G7K0_CLAB1|nr:uncharacterized protein Z519_04578 [Cladophialophora bantiana CBS 173.52]KIW94602.1 hypothetical protein Z519_04578 [Cladophialophora bantiana CBS 173.52]
MSSTGRSSVSSNASASSIPEPSPRQVSSICYPKGKWYDCLRPTTTPYAGFGNMTNFASMSGKESSEEAGESWTREVYGKMKHPTA